MGTEQQGTPPPRDDDEQQGGRQGGEGNEEGIGPDADEDEVLSGEG